MLSLERLSKELDNNNLKINSICKFEFVDSVKSKNVNQNNLNLELELLLSKFSDFKYRRLLSSVVVKKSFDRGGL